jgi:hypothetical protein
MTVCVGVAVNDCLVFAADSASTVVATDPATGQSVVQNVYRHGNKVFNLHKKLPICGMTAGMGNLGSSSIGDLAKLLRQRLMTSSPTWTTDRHSFTIQDIAQKARRLFFEENYQSIVPAPPAPHSFEFWVGGYGSDLAEGHSVWKVEIANGACNAPFQIVGPDQSGVFWGGQPVPAHRLVMGSIRAYTITLRRPELIPVRPRIW